MYSASLDICKIGLLILFIDIIQHTQFNEPFVGPSKLTDRLLEFVCGFNPADGDGGKMADRDTREQERHLYIESLHQDPKTKMALTLCLLAILGTGIFLYVFWSTWKYVPLPLDEGVSSSPI